MIIPPLSSASRNKLNSNINTKANKLFKFEGVANSDYCKTIFDNVFLVDLQNKRVDFHFVFKANKTITNWSQVCKLPNEIVEDSAGYNGIAFSNGKIGICYISPSNNRFLCPCSIDAPVDSVVNLFGSFSITKILY